MSPILAAPVDHLAGSSLPFPTVVLPLTTTTSQSTPVLSPTFVLCVVATFSSPVSHGEAVEAMNQDGDEDYFLELDDLVDSMVSTESSRKRKLEEGEECSSHGPA